MSREADRKKRGFTLSEVPDNRKVTQTTHERNQAETPDAACRGLQGEWAVPDTVTGTQGHACKNFGGNACEQ